MHLNLRAHHRVGLAVQAAAAPAPPSPPSTVTAVAVQGGVTPTTLEMEVTRGREWRSGMVGALLVKVPVTAAAVLLVSEAVPYRLLAPDAMMEQMEVLLD